MPESSSPWHQKLAERLRESWMPGDWFKHSPVTERHYIAKAEVIASFKPDTAIEIGTRCGYSLLAFHTARPGTRWLVIDGGMDDDSEQCLAHWRRVIGRYQIPADLIVANSHGIRRLPAQDFAHVDGDHSFTGCYADLNLVADCKVILADDYDNAEVAAAVDQFCWHHQRKKSVYNDGLRQGAIIT